MESLIEKAKNDATVENFRCEIEKQMLANYIVTSLKCIFRTFEHYLFGGMWLAHIEEQSHEEKSLLEEQNGGKK